MRISAPRVVLVAALAVLAVLGALPSTATGAPTEEAPITDVGPVAPPELHVMSLNLRYASDTPPNSWPQRRPVVRDLLRRERPHIIGTQEGLYRQLRDIGDDLPPTYESIGLGREGGSRGEAMQVFYDSRRLDPLEYDHFWLSDTPNVIGSKTWGGCCPRMVTWVRFLDRRTQTEFYLVNTHFEAFDATARSLSADLLRARVAEFEPGVPVIATGDFNEPAAPGRTVYDTLVTNGPFVDTWEEAERRSALVGTFHGYRPLTPGGDRIDWILTTPDLTTRAALINTFALRGQFPSDHLPVQAVVRLPQVLTVEAESLLPAVRTDAPAVGQESCCGATFSGGAQLWFQAREPGQAVTLALDVPRRGTYDIAGFFTQAADYGIHTLSVDGTVLGQPFDGYRAQLAARVPHSYGEVELTEGRHRLTFTVTGRNPASSGLFAGIDALRLGLAEE